MKFKKVNQQKYKEALRWIIKILKENKIKFNVLGGLAARAYGSRRMLVDIDLVMKDKDINKVSKEVKDYIIESPHYSKSKNWISCYFMGLNYQGIKIEISGNRGDKILNSKTKKWENLGDGLFDPTYKNVLGLKLPITPKDKLIAYKTKLMREVDITDLEQIT